MKKLLQKLVQFLLSKSDYPENRNQGASLLVSFLLALIMWLVVTLNQTYQTTLIYPVQITKLPAGIQFRSNQPHQEIEMLIEGPGLDLFWRQLKWNQKDTLFINFQEEFKKGYFSPRKYFSQIDRNISDNLRIKEIVTDSIFCTFDEQKRKKVQLISQVQIMLDPAVELFTSPILKPDSITVIGPESALDAIDSWYTEKVVTPRLYHPQTITIAIPDTFSALEISHEKAGMFIRPEYFTQTQISFYLKILDIPSDENVRLLKDSVSINVLVPMEKYDNLLSLPREIQFFYQDLDPNIPFIIPQPKFKGILPDYVKLLSYSPLKIPYVIVKDKT